MPNIYDARTILGVPSMAALADKQARVLNRQRARGIPVKAQTVAQAVPARIEQNRWLLDCYCGSGVAVHPEWSEARCLGVGCGRVYTNIVLPKDRRAIEGALLQRPFELNRNWDPRVGETAKSLQVENLAHGLMMVEP